MRWSTLYYRGIEYLLTVSGSTNYAKLQNDRWLNTSSMAFKKDASLLSRAVKEILRGAQAAGNTAVSEKKVREEILRHWNNNGLPFLKAGVLKRLRRNGGIYDYICHLLGVKSSSSIINAKFVLAVNHLVLVKMMPRLIHRNNTRAGYCRTWFPEENPELLPQVWELLAMLPSNDQFVKDCMPKIMS